MVATAAKWVPIMRARGADIVLISAHGGDSGTSSYGPELPNENPTALIAEQVPGIDAILFGHAHSEVPQRFVDQHSRPARRCCSPSRRSGASGSPGWTSPGPRARPVDGHARRRDHAEHQHGGRGPGGPRGGARPSTTRPSRTSTRSSPRPPWSCPPPSRGTRTPRSWTSSTTCRPRRSPRRWPAPQYASLPVLSIAAPFSRTAVFPPGDVKIRDVAGLYIFDNTLEAVVLTGAEVRAYLEYSAKYFRTLAAGRAGRPGDDQRPGRAGLQLRRRSPASTTTSTSPSRSASGSPG